MLNDVIGERKADHIEVCLKENVQSKRVTTGFEDVHLVQVRLDVVGQFSQTARVNQLG